LSLIEHNEAALEVAKLPHRIMAPIAAAQAINQ
jgi:hypothetical protein